jgi:two-component system response regulator FixJ
VFFEPGQNFFERLRFLSVIAGYRMARPEGSVCLDRFISMKLCQAVGMTMARNARNAHPETVIVVDADAGLRHSLWFSLAAEGFAVATYAKGTDLLGVGDLPKHACLVVDYNLPDMTGLELVAELRNRRIDLPIILVTNNPNAPLRRRAEQAGVPMIEKPLLGDSLLNGIMAAFAGSDGGAPIDGGRRRE